MSNPSTVHTFTRLIQPSFLSTSLSVAISFATVLFLLTPHLYKGSDFALYFDSIDITNNNVFENYQLVSDAVNTSAFAADASVFIVWMVIGLLAYSIVLSVIKFIASIVRFIRDEEYFKADRERLAREALIHLLIRAAAAAGLYGFYLLLMPYAISYIFVFAHAALTGSWLEGIWYVALMSVVIAACVHIVVILLRLVVLRLRVFFDRYTIDEA